MNIPEDAPATETAEAVEVVEAAETVETAETVEVVETTGIHEEASLTEPDDACACVEGGPQPSPAVSLTVIYDPYSGIDRETKLESHPISPKPDQAPLEPACAPSQLATNQAPLSAAPAPLSPAVLATYPTDFSTEVYLASELIADLCELLPYGTDVFTLLAEDYARARTLEPSPARGPVRLSPCASSTPTQSSRSASPSRSAGAPASNGSCPPSNRRDFSKAPSSSLAHQRKSAPHPNYRRMRGASHAGNPVRDSALTNRA
ncbi:MAG: hypothetical protein ACLTKG_06240 [Collinsella intestinalis]